MKAPSSALYVLLLFSCLLYDHVKSWNMSKLIMSGAMDDFHVSIHDEKSQNHHDKESRPILLFNAHLITLPSVAEIRAASAGLDQMIKEELATGSKGMHHHHWSIDSVKNRYQKSDEETTAASTTGLLPPHSSSTGATRGRRVKRSLPSKCREQTAFVELALIVYNRSEPTTMSDRFMNKFSFDFETVTELSKVAIKNENLEKSVEEFVRGNIRSIILIPVLAVFLIVSCLCLFPAYCCANCCCGKKAVESTEGPPKPSMTTEFTYVSLSLVSLTVVAFGTLICVQGLQRLDYQSLTNVGLQFQKDISTALDFGEQIPDHLGCELLRMTDNLAVDVTRDFDMLIDDLTNSLAKHVSGLFMDLHKSVNASLYPTMVEWARAARRVDRTLRNKQINCAAAKLVYLDGAFKPKPPAFGSMILDFLRLRGQFDIDFKKEIRPSLQKELRKHMRTAINGVRGTIGKQVRTIDKEFAKKKPEINDFRDTLQTAVEQIPGNVGMALSVFFAVVILSPLWLTMLTELIGILNGMWGTVRNNPSRCKTGRCELKCGVSCLFVIGGIWILVIIVFFVLGLALKNTCGPVFSEPRQLNSLIEVARPEMKIDVQEVLEKCEERSKFGELSPKIVGLLEQVNTEREEGLKAMDDEDGLNALADALKLGRENLENQIVVTLIKDGIMKYMVEAGEQVLESIEATLWSALEVEKTITGDAELNGEDIEQCYRAMTQLTGLIRPIKNYTDIAFGQINDTLAAWPIETLAEEVKDVARNGFGRVKVSFRKHLSAKNILNMLPDCRNVYILWNNMGHSVCHQLNLGVQDVWFGMLLAFVFLIPTGIFTLCLAKSFKEFANYSPIRVQEKKNKVCPKPETDENGQLKAIPYDTLVEARHRLACQYCVLCPKCTPKAHIIMAENPAASPSDVPNTGSTNQDIHGVQPHPHPHPQQPESLQPPAHDQQNQAPPL